MRRGRLEMMMILVMGSALALAGCGDDDDDGVTDTTTRDMGGGGDEDMGGGGDEDMGGGGDEDMGGGSDEDMGGGGTEPPVITRIEWTQEAGCSEGDRSDVTVVFTVTDPDTAAGDLSFSGTATGCDGTFDAASVTISCPQLAPYPSTVTVMDPDGNMDMENFTINICTDGSVEP